MMTRIYWLLYLTTTFTFALLAAAGNSCPPDYPFAFGGGHYCCANSMEDSLTPVDVQITDKETARSCNGGLISKSSRCCQDEQFVECENPPCENHGTCTTPKCQEVSKRVFEFMDPEANPCKDFYQFACGKFIREFQLPQDETFYNPLAYLDDVIYNRGKKIMEKVPQKKSAFISDEFSRKVYKACMNTSEIESNGKKNAKETFEKLGGWPAVEGDSWDADGYKWWNHDIKKVSVGLPTSHVLNIYLNHDFDDSKKLVLVLDQAKFGLGRDSLLEGFNGKDVQRYYKLMVDSAMLMGAKKDTVYEDMKQALLFEIALANISDSSDRWLDTQKMNNKRTIRELEGLPGYPSSLLDHINNYLASAGAPEVKFDLDDKVAVYNPAYLKKLSVVVNQASPRAISNYQSWRVFWYLVPLLHNDAKNLAEEYYMEEEGVEKLPPRWKGCLEEAGFIYWTMEGLNLAAGSLYAREHFTPEGKKQVEEMVKLIKKTFGKSLTKVTWMDRRTKIYSLRKLIAMREVVVYHDDLLNPDVMNKFFKDLNINYNYFDNTLAIKRFWRAHYYRIMRKPIDPGHFTLNQVVARGNAFYDRNKNSMTIPGGILQESFFDPFGPKFMNYGGIGAVIAHEISHGFDSIGSFFDLNGNVNPWMTEKSTQNFDKKTKCLIYQYGNITSKQANMTLNGIRTLAENIADFGGVKVAYSAYEQDIEANGDELILPGVSLNPRQSFWLFNAQTFCDKWRTQALKDQILGGTHSPGEFRINVPLSNNPDFAKDYKCPRGSPMNPVHKCEVW